MRDNGDLDVSRLGTPGDRHKLISCFMISYYEFLRDMIRPGQRQNMAQFPRLISTDFTRTHKTACPKGCSISPDASLGEKFPCFNTLG